MISNVGNARVTLSLLPDPPQPGPEVGTIGVEGIAQGALATTTVTYSSAMPTMSMSGAAGTAVRVPGQPNRWKFQLPMAEATRWALTLHFSGGFTGSASFAFNVGSVSFVSGGAMAAMGAGHEDVWRSLALALAILIALGALAALFIARSLRASGRMPQWLNRSTVTIATVAVIVVIVAAVIQSRFAPPSMDMSAMSNVQGVAPIPVTLARAERLSFGRVIAAPGAIQALLTEDVVARAPGILRNFTAYNGTHVLFGETLAFLEAPELGAQASAASAIARSDQAAAEAAMIEAHHHAPNELAIAQAGAAAKTERARYWRSEMLREKLLLDNGAVSQQEFDDETAQAAAAYADAESATRSVHDAMANLEMTQQQAVSAQERAASSGAAAEAAGIMAGYTRVVAPSDGIVVKRLVDPGSYVQSGTLLLRIAVINKARIQANVAQEDLSGIRTGSRLDATLQSGRVIHTLVTSIQPAADATTHTAQVEAIVDNPDGRLVPGTYVRVLIFGPSARPRSGVSVPSSAIVGAGPDTVVWTDVDGAAHRVPVKVLSDDGTTAQVAGEIKSGDRVVVEGADNLEEGMPIAGRAS
ncbi:MAG TPA: efflux RND transporter periplasmic adaptor subunit [Candidatus Acidoferrales bacterium]|nr:efflux RND transporter periplasmic adaptor subunit [Candidatus Acidoferrales bacterium]